jgi:hypothetical protein
MFPTTAAFQNQPGFGRSSVSGIVFYFQANQGLGNRGNPQAFFCRGYPRDKAEDKAGQAREPQPFKQAMGGFQLQTDGAGLPGVGMAKVGKDEAPRKNRGNGQTGSQNDKRKLFLRQLNHECYYKTKKSIMQPPAPKQGLCQDYGVCFVIYDNFLHQTIKKPGFHTLEHCTRTAIHRSRKSLRIAAPRLPYLYALVHI